MEAFFTASVCRPGARLPSTAKAFHGLLCERAALAYCRRRRYRVVGRNVRSRLGEIDLVAEVRGGDLVLIEVRGKRSALVAPSRTLAGKRLRLERLAKELMSRARRPVRLELVEITGRGPKRRWRGWLLVARFWPEALGLRLQSYRIER